MEVGIGDGEGGGGRRAIRRASFPGCLMVVQAIHQTILSFHDIAQYGFAAAILLP